MGTFHDDMGELHGITVVVDTTGPTVAVGRCHEERPAEIVLLDAALHSDGDAGQTKSAWIAQAAKWGVFPQHKSLRIPREQIATVERLGDVARRLAAGG
jgi:hypothetical protein